MPPATRFIKSAVWPQDYPPALLPEIALIGRSNAGKSSLLNALTGHKIAKVSQTPGKTRLLNFFEFGSHYRLVDMPGYGFAARSGDEVLAWEKMITSYFENRDILVGVILVMDGRREWQEEEEWLGQWCEKLGLPLWVALNKSDKMTKQEQKTILQKMTKRLPQFSVHLVSAFRKTGVKELEEDVFNRAVQPWRPEE